MTLVEGRTGKWEVVIGLEVHAQVTSKSKLFSSSATEFGAAPNSQVSLVDAAMPGMLPVLNKFCIEQAVKTGLGLNCHINAFSRFDRKNYFYADLPQGYQISQLYHPIIGRGYIEIETSNNDLKKINIHHIHLEQDAGKSIHDQHPKYSLIDLNRSGVALLEIVTEPDMRSSQEAGEFIKVLRNILRYLETCDGDMEKGSLRCDANVSVCKPGKEFGTRCEIKNLNSIRNIIRAIDFEVERQIEIIENDGVINQETRLFNANTGETRTLRSKEDAHDYRYFPDPDLLEVNLSEEYINEIRAKLPELPDHKKKRYVAEYGLTEYDAKVLSADKQAAKFFEEVAYLSNNPKLAANWVTGEFFGRLNKNNQSIAQSKVTAHNLAELINLIMDETISGKIAKDVFDIMFKTGEEANKIIEDKGLKQITNKDQIEAIIDEILTNNPDKVAEYKAGKDKLFGFFVGQTMKNTGGKANPSTVNEILGRKLK